jgi:uncharacterized protein YcfJ
MKNSILIAIFMGILSLSISCSTFAEGVDKTVCKAKLDKGGQPVKDKKGNEVQVCKKIKVHKKLSGDDKVPGK